jgi:hypothetical protein
MTQKFLPLARSLIFICGLLSMASDSQAGALEISGTIAYGKANLGKNAYSRQNRYSAEIAWRFTKVSAFEASYMRSRTKISQPISLDFLLFQTINQAVTYDDQVISLSWVQNLVPSSFIVQPYFKVGGGRLFRRQTVEYSALFSKQVVSQKSDTGVGGLGLRIFLTKNMALKGEVVTYVPKFRFSTWKDSQMFSVGLSWIF